MILPDGNSRLVKLTYTEETTNTAISRKVVEKKKMCTQQSWKVIWDMINALFLTLQLWIYFCSTRKHTSKASRATLSDIFWRTVNSKPPTIPFGIVACTLPANCLEIALYRVTERAKRGIFDGWSDTSSKFLNGVSKTVLIDTKDLLPDPKKRRTVNFILILGDPGAVSRDDRIFVMKVYCKIVSILQ